MRQVSIAALFDSVDVAASAARALNAWFGWVMEGSSENMPDIFEDFGLDAEEWALDRDTDTDWEDTPTARAKGASVRIQLWTNETSEMLEGLLESMGAYEVEVDEGDDED
jgi:hypothetical protein